MADDEEKKKHTLDSLFLVYCNHKVLPGDFDTEYYDCILLSQIDYWMEKAKLIPLTFTRTQTGLGYIRYKKWRLDYEDFLELLQQLCTDNEVSLDDIKEQMLDAGVPSGAV